MKTLKKQFLWQETLMPFLKSMNVFYTQNYKCHNNFFTLFLKKLSSFYTFFWKSVNAWYFSKQEVHTFHTSCWDLYESLHWTYPEMHLLKNCNCTVHIKSFILQKKRRKGYEQSINCISCKSIHWKCHFVLLQDVKTSVVWKWSADWNIMHCRLKYHTLHDISIFSYSDSQIQTELLASSQKIWFLCHTIQHAK